MTRALLLGAVLSACGRIDFAARPDDDAAIGDGDSTDAPADDANGDAPGVTCPSSSLLCEGFETMPFPASTWMAYGDVAFDTSIAHRGAASLRMRVPATAANTEVFSFITHSSSIITTATTLWIRGWYRISLVPASTNALELVAVQQDGGQGNYIFLRSNDTELYHQFDGGNAGAGVPPPANTWFCLVWQLTLSTTNGASTVTSDAVPTFAIASGQTQGSPVVDVLGFGPYYASTNLDVATPQFDVWVDDILVAASAVTCAD